MAWKAIEDLKRGFLEAFDAAAALPISVTGLGLATEATLAAIAALLTSGGSSAAAILAAIKAKTDQIPTLGPQTAAASLSVATSQQPCTVAPVEIAIADGTSTQSAALTAGRYIITADLDVAFLQGADPTATSSSCKLPEGSFRWIDIVEGNKVAAIRKNSGETGTVSLERQA